MMGRFERNGLSRNDPSFSIVPACDARITFCERDHPKAINHLKPKALEKQNELQNALLDHLMRLKKISTK